MSIDAELNLGNGKIIALGPIFQDAMVTKFFKRDTKSRITQPFFSFAREAIGLRKSSIGWSPSSYSKDYLKAEKWAREKVISPVARRTRNAYEKGRALLRRRASAIP